MAHPPIIHSVVEFIEMTFMREFSVGLEGKPVRPWYLGQPSEGDKLLPPLYRMGIEATLERELLREFRMRVSEFNPANGVPDDQWPLIGHQNGLPTRILEWTGNPLVALFHAVESMATDRHGQVWIFNPWQFNELSAKIQYVPMVSSDLFKEQYVVNLNDPEASPVPAAEAPLAFRPYRNVRPQNTRDIYYTVFGSRNEPLDQMKFFLHGKKSYIRKILIHGDSKKAIMKELHLLGITQVNLFPGAPSLARTLAYSFSSNYLDTEI